MAAETLTSARASATFPVGAHGPAGDCKIGWGTYSVAAQLEDGDIFEMHWIPAGATVVTGFLFAGDMDTGIETLDMDIGWAANNSDVADPDGFGNLGVWTGDTSSHIAGLLNWFPYQGVILSAGPKTFASGGGKTMVQVEANAPAAAFAAGVMTAVTLFTVP